MFYPTYSHEVGSFFVELYDFYEIGPSSNKTTKGESVGLVGANGPISTVDQAVACVGEDLLLYVFVVHSRLQRVFRVEHQKNA